MVIGWWKGKGPMGRKCNNKGYEGTHNLGIGGSVLMRGRLEVVLERESNGESEEDDEGSKEIKHKGEK